MSDGRETGEGWVKVTLRCIDAGTFPGIGEDRSSSFPGYLDSRCLLSFIAVKSQGDMFAPGGPLDPARLPFTQEGVRLFLEQSFLDNGQEQTPPLPWALWLSEFQTQFGNSCFGRLLDGCCPCSLCWRAPRSQS